MQGALRESAEKKLYHISHYYLENYKEDFRQNAVSLLGGRAGTILLQSLFLQATCKDKFKAEIESNIEF